MDTENRALAAQEVLEATFQELNRQLSGKVVELEEPVEVEMAGISSVPGNKIPCLRYRLVLIVTTGRKRWAVVLGSATSNSNNLYTCDIIALSLPREKEPEEKLFELISSKKNELVFFQNSVAYSLCDGTFRFSGGYPGGKPNPLGQKMAEKMKCKVRAHLFQELVSNGLLGPGRYKPSIVPVMASAIAQTLEEVELA